MKVVIAIGESELITEYANPIDVHMILDARMGQYVLGVNLMMGPVIVSLSKDEIRMINETIVDFHLKGIH